MRSRRRRQAVVLFSLASLCALLALACSPSVKGAHHPAAPLPLSNPTRITAGPVSLTVGTNHWNNPAIGVEEAFFPVAVTVRNTGNQPLCGGVSTAALGDSAGASVSAIFPEGVVTRLFGPFASATPMPQPAVKAAALADQAVFLVFVQSSLGGHSGGMSHGGRGFQGGTPGPSHFAPSPPVLAPPHFSSPFHSPLSPFTPGSRGTPVGGTSHSGGGFRGGVVRPPHFAPSPEVFAPRFFYSPFSSPFSPFTPSPFYSPFSPFIPSPFSPFYHPFPPLSPYGYPPADSGYGPVLPPTLQPWEEEPPAVDQALVTEIVTAAFASRPLAPQEERSGFLFFPLPVPHVGATVLTWGWYDCVTHELVAHLVVPIAVDRKV